MATLESLIEKLIASLDANTAAHKGGPVVASTAGKATGTTKPKAPEISLDTVKAAAVKVKEAHGQPFTKKIIEDAGKAKGLTDVKPENYPALMAAFEEALAAPKEPEGEDDGDL